MRKVVLQVSGGALPRLTLALSGSAAAVGPATIQITDSSVGDIRPAISGSDVLWKRRNAGSDDACNSEDSESYLIL